MKKIRLRLLVFVIALIAGFSLVASQTGLAADDQVPPGVAKKGKVPGKGSHKGWKKGKHKGWNEKGEKKEKKEEKKEQKKETEKT